RLLPHQLVQVREFGRVPLGKGVLGQLAQNQFVHVQDRVLGLIGDTQTVAACSQFGGVHSQTSGRRPVTCGVYPCPRPGEGNHQGTLIDVIVQQESVQGGVHQSRVGAVEGTDGQRGVEQLHLGQE